MTILVTGGTGLIGREVVKQLSKKGERVIVLDITSLPPDLKDLAEPVKGDIRVWNHVVNAVNNYKPNAIFHLAALLSLMCEEDPWAGYETNFQGTYNVLEAARMFNVEKVLFSSSLVASVCPEAGSIITDFTVQRPRVLYGISKVFGELMGGYYTTKFGIDFRAVRYPEVIGPGVKHPGVAQCIPWAIEHALKKEPFTIWLPKDARVPLMYYKDAAKALIDLYYAPQENIKTRVYNVVGLELTVGEFVQELKKVIPDADVNIKPSADIMRMLGGVKIEKVDDSRAREEWGWRSRYDSINLVIKEFKRELEEK